MKIFLTRHAQKDKSKKTTKESHYHRELTDFGKEQAFLLGEYLKNYDINKIYTSDMLRAVQTSSLVKKNLNAQIIDKTKALREADPCIIPNHPQRDEIKKKCWDNWEYDPPIGESYETGRKRFATYLEKEIINKSKENDKILIISHGRVIRLFLCNYLKDGFEVIKKRYNHVAITELEVIKTKKIKIIRYNDNSYLPNRYQI